MIEEIGVQPYEGSVRLIDQLRDRGFRMAVVTSSQNCAAVLRVTESDNVFEVQVDGNTLHEQHLTGKPAPTCSCWPQSYLGSSLSGRL